MHSPSKRFSCFVSDSCARQVCKVVQVAMCGESKQYLRDKVRKTLEICHKFGDHVTGPHGMQESRPKRR